MGIIAQPAKPMMNVHELGVFFHDVQLSGIFEDSKTFVDLTPKFSCAYIAKQYEQEKGGTDFNLRVFVSDHFEKPKTSETEYQSDLTESAEAHLLILWDVLTKKADKEAPGTLIPLPFPYIIPGGRFSEIYYWDSYFTMLGLQVSGRYDLIESMIDNFSYLIDLLGYIPNGNRTYFLGRSQPPFYALMVDLFARAKGKDVLLKYLPQLEKEYAFWMKNAELLNSDRSGVKRVVRIRNGGLLNRYWDENNAPREESYKEDVELYEHTPGPTPQIFRHIRAACESGWDFSSRWFADGANMSSIHTTEILPVDLNCLLYFLEQKLGEAYHLAASAILAVQFEQKSDSRKRAIQELCWSESAEYYFDYDFVLEKQKDVYSLAAVFPLFFNVATAEQARQVSKALEEKFLKKGGLATTDRTTGQQWDAPNGWAPLQWMAYQGLRNYGIDGLAEEIKKRWTDSNIRVYQETGKMMEKYNVEENDLIAGGGEYPAQDGFGWTNGVALKFLRS